MGASGRVLGPAGSREFWADPRGSELVVVSHPLRRARKGLDRGGRDDRSYDAARDDVRYASGSDSGLQDVSDDSDDDSDEYSSGDDSSYDGDSGSSDV